MPHRQWNTYKRGRTTLQDVIHYDRACYTYNWATGETTIKEECVFPGSVQQDYAIATVAQIRELRKCLVQPFGLQRDACIQEEQWRTQIGEDLYQVFKDQTLRTQRCRTSRRRLEDET